MRMMSVAALAALLMLGSTAAGPYAQSGQSGSPRPLGAAAVSHERLAQADREPGEWMAGGGSYFEQHYSPLDQLNETTVKTLGLAWSADIDTERGQEATPVVVDGVLYVSTAWSMVKAYDIKSGRLRWEYDPAVAKAKAADACCDVVNRGVAVWNGKVYVGVLDGRLVALNSATGAVVWSTQTTDPTQPYTITGAPRIVKGKVVIGNGGAEYRGRGYVTAYDAETGRQAWRWYTVPGDPSKPYEQPELARAARTWRGDYYWKIGGGGTVWDGMAYDPELDTLYIGTGNGTPWNQGLRSPGGGDNLYLSSIVALNPTTGAYKWHYQTTPGESWDYTATQPIVIADLQYPTGKRRVVMQAPKNGFFYVLDARTGRLLSAEKYSPLNWATGVDMKTGRPIEVDAARYEITQRPVILSPGALGMHNWHPMAFHPKTGLVYIPVAVNSAPYSGPRQFKESEKGWNTGVDFTGGAELYNQPGAPARGNIESYILAFDPVKGREAFRIKNAVYGASGVLATGGNLIFSGNHSGEFVAYRATDGEKLWSAPAQARVVAGASTFMVDGQQHVAILVGARGLPDGQVRTNPSSANNSRVLVFKVGGSATLPAAMPANATTTSRTKIEPPLLTASNETVFAGQQAYQTNCAQCHGPEAVPGAGSTAPDLRYSGLLPFLSGLGGAWNNTVRDGDRAQRGMPGFGRSLPQD
ncbi:MAG: PQQ-dependent dehydrogenase, methanol/ethanol family, partial [Vicinamibacterales bacterium]